MSLDWNISKIKDYNKVCFVDDGKETKLSPLTRTLIFATMPIGIPVITEENAAEFFMRCHAYETVNGVWRYRAPNDCGPMEDDPIRPGEIRQHIGLRTNAERLSDHKFSERLVGLLKTQATNKWDNFLELLKTAPATPDANNSVPQG